MTGGLFIFLGIIFLARSCMGVIVPGFEQYGDIFCERIYEGGYANQLLYGKATGAESKATPQCVLRLQNNLPTGSNGFNFVQCVLSPQCTQNQNSGSCDDSAQYNYDNYDQNLEDYYYNNDNTQVQTDNGNSIKWKSNEATFLPQNDFKEVFSDSCNCTLEVLPFCALVYEKSPNGSIANSEFPIVTSDKIPSCQISVNNDFSCSKSSNYYCSLQAQPKVTYMQGTTQKDYGFFVQDSTFTCQLSRNRPRKPSYYNSFSLSAYYVFTPVGYCLNWYNSIDSYISGAYQGLFIGNGTNCYGSCEWKNNGYVYTSYCSISQSGLAADDFSDPGSLYELIQQWHQTVLQKISSFSLSGANYNINLNFEIDKISIPTTQNK